jgi:hypothetical protein
MSRRFYAVPLGTGGWILVLSMWLLMGILLWIYPTTSLFWYYAAFGTLIIALCYVAMNIVSSQRVPRNARHVIWYKTGDWRSIINMLILALVLFIFGFIMMSLIQFDHVPSIPLFSPSSMVIFKIIWMGIQLILGVTVIFIATQSIRILYAYLKSPEQRTSEEP